MKCSTVTIAIACIIAAFSACGHVPQEEYPDETARLIIDSIEGKPIEELPIPAAK